jgi:conjugative relaxase-like TrwC/TraI family protein
VLSIKPIGSSSQEVAYYQGLGQEDYYVGGGEPPGTWWGEGARLLGLSGQVDGKQFASLLSGRSPCGERDLVKNAGHTARRAGFDLCWSVPKSVSALFSQADYPLRKQIEAAGERAVVGALETFADLCGVTRRGKQGERTERANLVVAIFRHDTAREVAGELPDPNLHWHTVVSNVVVREDGTTGAFDARELFRSPMKMTLGALFRAELSKELRTLGFESYRPETRRDKLASWFELRGIPERILQEFSKRRKEITAWLKDRGLFGGKAAEKANLATRRGKVPYRRIELLQAWLATGKRLGFSTREVAALRQELRVVNTPHVLEEVLQRSLQSLTQHWARFSELELLRTVAEDAQCRGLGIDDIRAGVRRLLHTSERIVPLESVRGVPQFTTPEMLELEAQLFQRVLAARGDARHQVTGEWQYVVTSKYPTLFAEQEAAIRHITGKSDAITCVNGMAGTGKTTMLKVAREIWEAAGLQVIGTALAAKACKGLEEGAGIGGTHIHSLLKQVAAGGIALNERTVLVVDEAGMVGTRMMDQLVTLVQRAGGKLVCVGDHRQLQAIDAGSPFRWMAENLGCVEMVQIVRQREDWAKDAVRAFAKGTAESALQEFHRRGQLVIAEDRDAAMKQLVADWFISYHHAPSSLVLASTRFETLLLNRMCQLARLEAGDISGEGLEVAGEPLFVGDRVVFTKNQRALLVRNGMLGTVTEMNQQENEIRIRLDDGLQVRIQLDVFDSLELGYAINVHRAQGMTVDSAFVLAGGSMTDRELSYVQASRARESTRIYTDVTHGGPDIEALAAQMNRSRPKDMAHDHLIRELA